MRRLAFFTASLGIALGACAADHGSPSAPGPTRPRSGRFEVTITANDADGQVSVHGEGAFDEDRQRYSLSVDAGASVVGFSDSAAVDVVQLPGATFIRSAALNRVLGVHTPWARISGPAGRSLVDVRELLDRLVGAGTMRFDASGESAGASVRFDDEGAPVTIEEPNAADVTDATVIVEALARRDTGG